MKKFLSILCAVCMILSLSVPALAVATESSEIQVDTSNQTQTVSLPVTSSYGFYKVWFSNTTSNSMIRVALYRGKTTGDPINYVDVPAGQALSLHNPDADSPLETDTYYLVLSVIGGTSNLSGRCFYKNASTYADVAVQETRPSTQSVEIQVNSSSNTQAVNWPVTSSYGFYKVWFSNTTGNSTIRVALYRGNPTGDPISYVDVPAGQALALHNPDANSPLESDTYTLVLKTLDDTARLGGLCFYKNAASYAEVS